MNRRAQGLLLLLTGLVAFRLVVTGTYDAYVQSAMRWPLLAASAFLVALGVGTAFHAAWREDRRARGDDPADDPADAHAAPDPAPVTDDHGHDHDHGHQHRPFVGWLLALPLAVLLLVAPASLGADAATRQEAYTPEIAGTVFPPLPEPTDGAVDLRIGEFVDRALWDEGGSLDDTPVRLTGFVVHDPAVDGFVLARFRIACCAADAIPIKVAVLDDGGRPPEDQWLEVVGVAVDRPPTEPGADEIPQVELTLTSYEAVDEPASPYE